MQFPTNRFKAALQAGKPQIGVWSSLCSNIVADVLGTAGYDWALIDMEHSPNEMTSVLGQLQAYEVGGTTPVVRPPWNEPVIVKRLLDIGATSLLFPMVQTPEEAAAAVRATRYAPNGVRGVSLATRTNRYGRIKDYLGRIEQEICVLVQAETRAAIARAAEIAAVPGVDGVFFGPADISADMGLLGQPGHPDVAALIREGHDRVASVGKPSGILVNDVNQAVGWVRQALASSPAARTSICWHGALKRSSPMSKPELADSRPSSGWSRGQPAPGHSSSHSL